MNNKQSTETPTVTITERPKMRKCLGCQEPFESEWSGNRVCKRCKGSAAWRQGG